MQELLNLRLGPITVVIALVLMGLPLLALAGFVLQRWGWLPRAPSPAQRSLRTDLAFLMLSPLTELCSRTLSTLGIAGCALLIGHHVGPEVLAGFGPLAKQPRWLMLIEMLVLSDFIYYWTHRLAHSVPLLWRFHAVHHSTRHLRWSSALRAHPAEIYVHLVNAVPLCLLGFPVDALAVLAPIVTLYALLIHTNRNVSLRRLSYVVNTPVYHAWHHALDARDGGTNFAGFFPIFDAMFGTYRLPAHPPHELGIDDVNMPDTWLAQLRYPFRRRRRALQASASPGFDLPSATRLV